MKVPFKWLGDFVDLEGVTAQQLADRLLAVGVAIEIVENRNPLGISGVVVGRIAQLEPHPNADRLRVAQVDFGGRTLQIVTGAPNVQQGHVVPVALEGARVLDRKEGKLFSIGKSKLRGLPSEGMMCSADELGIVIKDLPVDQREGVLVFPPDTPLGADVLDLLAIDEQVLVVEPFANRPDFLSIMGIAREAAAALGRPLKPLDVAYDESDSRASERIAVEIADTALCPRYTARVLDEVRTGPTPLWMQGRLHAAGVRSVNNVVDVTNYVMIETGQPLHAFDFGRLRGGRITVRSARDGEKMQSIDGVERPLDPSMLVIADAEGAVAIAGVMGGLESEVSSETTAVLLESATFGPASVRRTSNRLALRSESSRRFEKGLDWHTADLASRRAAALLQRLCGAKAAAGFVDAGGPAPLPVHVTLRPSRVNHVLGAHVEAARMYEILRGLGFEVRDSGTQADVAVPSFRLDVRREEDLVEEIARHYGYDNIPSDLPRASAAGRTNPQDRLEESLRDLLAEMDLDEAITFSLLHPSAYASIGWTSRDDVTVKNPLVADQSALRTTLLPHLVGAVEHNLRARARRVRLFEISKIYVGGEVPAEHRRLALALAGDGQGFFHLKGVLDGLLQRLHLEGAWSVPAAVGETFHPGKTAWLDAAGERLGVVGALHPQVQGGLGLDHEVVVAELDLDVLSRLAGERRTRFRSIARFPEVERDLALVVDREVSSGQVEREVTAAGGGLLQGVRCFDVYTGDPIPEGKKSMAYHLAFQSHERTLTDAEIDAALQAVIAKVGDALGASIRA